MPFFAPIIPYASALASLQASLLMQVPIASPISIMIAMPMPLLFHKPGQRPWRIPSAPYSSACVSFLFISALMAKRTAY